MTRGQLVKNEIRRWMLEDLARSGLTEAEAVALRLKPWSRAKTLAMTGYDRPAYEFPYHDLAGKPLGFSRLRFLDSRDPRYWQEPGTLPRLYLPTLLEGGWKEVAGDPSLPLYLTEGEKKAAKACAVGLPTLGLGGVWAWRSKKKETGSRLSVEDLDAVVWEGRSVLLVFDSDIVEKLEVQAALRALAEELISRGARPQSIKLPTGPAGQKVGLDDFLMAESVASFQALDPSPILGRLADELWRLNQELVYIEEANSIWWLPTHQFVSAQALVSTAMSNRTVVTTTLDGKIKEVNAAKKWLEWPCRRVAKRLAFEPGEPVELVNGGLNLWRGWGCAPLAGDVEPWHALLGYLFDGAPESRQWFERWCAYPIQHPGAKLYTAVILFSLAHGIGKSLVGMTLGKIYGSSFVLLSQEDLQSPFNSWAAERQFALADEITGAEKRRDADRIKNLVTRDLVTINAKYQPPYTLPDRLNYLFTTNHPDAFIIDRRDRRFFVHETPLDPLPPEFYTRYDQWLKGLGPAALHAYLLQVDTSKFNPHAQAPASKAKADMAELAKSPLDLVAEQLYENPESALKVDDQSLLKRDLYTLEELMTLIDPLEKDRRFLTKISLGKALRRAGGCSLDVTLTSSGPKRLWPIRNLKHWAKASHAQRAADYTRAKPRLTVVEGLDPPKKAKF